VAKARIGISGWRYAMWRKSFYPQGLTQARELEFASRKLRSIELNGSFYSLQRPESYVRWREATPPGFVFAVKGSRFITHMKKLRDIDVALANFYASGVLALDEKLGPFLWQLPPVLAFDRARLASFFERLPRDTAQAALLARRHDARLSGRAWVTTGARRKLRHAVEVRHASYADPAFVALLREHEVGLVVAETAGKWPMLEDVTADFVYVRLHGDEELYASGYSPAALDAWAARIRAWLAGGQPAGARCASPEPARASAGRDVYVYFDNDIKVHAPYDALSLAARLGVRPRSSAPTGLGPGTREVPNLLGFSARWRRRPLPAA